MVAARKADLALMEERVPKALAIIFATPCPRLSCAAHTDKETWCTTPSGAIYGTHRERQNAAGVVDRRGNYLEEYVG
jgi:hypothetical protein